MSGVSFQPRSFGFPPASAAASSSNSGAEQAAYEQLVGQGIVTGTGASSNADEASTAQLHRTLARMALYARKTRLELAPFFTDFDRHRQGALSCPQFARVLATCMAGLGLTHDLVANLSAHYALPADPMKVSYKSFISDIETIAAAQQQAANTELQRSTQGPTLEFQRSLQERPLVRQDGAAAAAARPPFGTAQHDIHSDASAPLTAQKLLHKIQTLCQTKRVVLNDIFADFDSLRKNLITLARFRRCLDVAGFQLSDAEANILVGAYASERDPNQVQYKRFVDDVEAPFIPKHPEASPAAKELPSFSPYRLEEQETPQVVFSADEQHRIEQLLRELGYQVMTRRVLVKPSFQLHDGSRSGCVTARQFASVLTATFPIVRFSAKDLDLLAAKYRKANFGVCYAAFVADVEERERGAGEYAKTLHPSHAAAALSATMGAGYGSSELQPLPSAKGAAYVAGMRIVPSKSDLEAQQASQDLATTLAHTLNKIREALNGRRMHIDDICQHSHSRTHTLAHTRAQQRSTTHPRTRDSDVRSVEAAPVSHSFLTRFSSACWRCCVCVFVFLFVAVGDFDHLNKGRVTRAQFFRALTQAGLKLSASDVSLLTASYPHAEIPADVDYRKFTADLSTGQTTCATRSGMAKEQRHGLDSIG